MQPKIPFLIHGSAQPRSHLQSRGKVFWGRGCVPRSFFAPKPQGNARYAGYFFSHFHVVILNASYSPKILHANCFYKTLLMKILWGEGKGGKSRCIMGHVRVANTAVFDQAQVTNSRMIDKWRCKT